MENYITITRQSDNMKHKQKSKKWKESYDQPRQHIKKHFVNKHPSSQGYGFSSGLVWMWELDYKESCRRIDAFELWC